MRSFGDLETLACNLAWGIVIAVLHICLQVYCTPTKKPVNGSSTIEPTTISNSTTSEAVNPMKTNLKGIGIRAIYVVTVVSGIVVIYFVVRAVCSRRRKNRTRRYGILNTENRDSMEMRPLSEQDDDDDEDMTLFDMSKRKGKR